MATVVLKAGHIQPVWAGHPWVYAQAVHRIEGGAVAGDEVAVTDPRGNYIGRGFYSPGSAIPVRILLRDRETAADVALFRARLQRAVEHRRLFGLPSQETNALRIVNAEGDDLPGLVVDVFGDVVVVQIGTVGMKRREGGHLRCDRRCHRSARHPRSHVRRDRARRKLRPRTRRGPRGHRRVVAVVRRTRLSLRAAPRAGAEDRLLPGSDGRCAVASSSSRAAGACSTPTATSELLPWRRRAAARPKSWRWTKARSPSKSARNAPGATGSSTASATRARTRASA